MLIHHLSLGTNDVERSARFYDPVLAIVGLTRSAMTAKGVDYSAGTYLFSLETPVDGNAATPGNGVHVAFAIDGRDRVDAFHRTALAHGGTDAGAPGLRPEYDGNYYGAFVFDPDGNKIEAVTYSAD